MGIFRAATDIGATRWYVDNPEVFVGTTQGSFDKWDFKLYSRDTVGWGGLFADELEPFVECGSCHDPHMETTTFLRMPGTVDNTTESNLGSQVCLACHTK